MLLIFHRRYLLGVFVYGTLITKAFISMWLLHILSTRGQSNITSSNKFARFRRGDNVSCVCAEEWEVFLSFNCSSADSSAEAERYFTPIVDTDKQSVYFPHIASYIDRGPLPFLSYSEQYY